MFQELLNVGDFFGHVKTHNWEGTISKAEQLLTCLKNSDILYKTI